MSTCTHVDNNGKCGQTALATSDKCGEHVGSELPRTMCGSDPSSHAYWKKGQAELKEERHVHSDYADYLNCPECRKKDAQQEASFSAKCHHCEAGQVHRVCLRGYPPPTTPPSSDSLDWRSPISIEELLDMRRRRQTTRDEILRRKGNDYNAQQQNSGDTLFNLRVCELMGIVSSPIDGILVRLSDKLMRLTSLTRPGVNQQVLDEKIEDTVDDAVNYLDYLLAIWKRAHGRPL